MDNSPIAAAGLLVENLEGESWDGVRSRKMECSGRDNGMRNFRLHSPYSGDVIGSRTALSGGRAWSGPSYHRHWLSKGP